MPWFCQKLFLQPPFFLSSCWDLKCLMMALLKPTIFSASLIQLRDTKTKQVGKLEQIKKLLMLYWTFFLTLSPHTLMIILGFVSLCLMDNTGNTKGGVSLYRWPPVWLVWNRPYDYRQFVFYLQNRLIQTSQSGGQWYSDTSPFSIPWTKYC